MGALLKLTRIRIKRFRCINDMSLQLDSGRGLITFCGENNTGKTNTLRAIALFFDPQRYEAAEDSPYHKFYGSRGQAVFPEIEICFDLGPRGCFKIRRTFGLQGLDRSLGWEIRPSGSNKRHLNDKEIRQVLDNFIAPMIEVANVSLPDIITGLISDVYDIEFANARFRGAKKQLKDALEDYRSSLLVHQVPPCGGLPPSARRRPQIGSRSTANRTRLVHGCQLSSSLKSGTVTRESSRR